MLIDIHMTVRHNLYGKGEVTKYMFPSERIRESFHTQMHLKRNSYSSRMRQELKMGYLTRLILLN